MSFVDAHDFSVGLVLRVLDVPASTYYDLRARRTSPSPRRRGDEQLLTLIAEIRDLRIVAGKAAAVPARGRKRVERIMRENGLRGAYLRKGWKGGSTKQNPRHTVAPDLLGRDFTAAGAQHQVGRGPDADPHRRGSAVVASVRDAFSNKVVGWRSGPRADTDLVLSALDYALFSRDVRGGELIFHSGVHQCLK